MEDTQDRTCLDIEYPLEREPFVHMLRRLADSVEAGGSFEYEIGGERIAVPATASFSIERERLGDDEELEFQIKWALTQQPDAEASDDDLP